MSRLEIIHLRSWGMPFGTLSDLIRRSIHKTPLKQSSVILYRRNDLETDLAIHILQVEPREEYGPSVLGLRLASALGALGLVEHTVWEEAPSEDATSCVNPSIGSAT
jgi:hypothetical protein